MEIPLFRAQFPALGAKAWLKTASVAPAARPVLAALRAAVDGWEHGELELRTWDAQAQATRALFARLLGADTSQVALTTSVAQAAATVAALVPRGRVVVGELEYRSNLFPWLALRERGVTVTEVPMPDHVLRTQRMLDAINGDTVLVAVSDVQSASGSRVDLAAIGERARHVGARLFVDATQSLGVLGFPLRETAPDFVAVHGYKWLISPRGAAWLYVREPPERQVPIAPSWRSAPDPFLSFYGGPLELATDARRMDASLAWPTWLGARAALELITSLDAAEAQAHALRLGERFASGLGDIGLEPAASDLPSHIVTCAVPDGDRVLGELAAAGVLATQRAGRLRVGFHAFNDQADVDRCLLAVADAVEP
jgi:selenocysteine lyase/cysteine desulfurase